MRALFLTTALLHLPLIAQGQTSADSVFAPLSTWGLPDVTSAMYVRVSGDWNVNHDGALSYHKETSGNAWLLEETRGQSGRLVLGWARVTEAVWTPDRYPKDNPDLFAKPETDRRARVTWQPAHLERDLKLFSSYLATANRQAVAGTISARLFLMAYQLYQRGDTQAAEQLIHGLVATGTTLEYVQSETLDLVAEQQLRSLNQTFQDEQDWEKFLQGLEALRDRFSSRWKFQPGLNLLIERVRERLMPEPAANDPTQRLGQRLEDIRTLRVFGYNRPEILLLVPETWRGTNVIAGDSELEWWALGLEAIPLLLARADDSRLTRMDVSAAQIERTYGLGLLFPGQPADKIYEQLPRPATRGEVATRLLKNILPDSVSGPSWKTLSRDELKKAAQALYDRCTGRGTAAVLVEYLDQRNSSALSEQALRAFRPLAVAGPVPALETYLDRPLKDCAEEDQFSFGIGNLAEQKARYLATYAGWRGAEAQPLVERFVADLEISAVELQSPTNYNWSNPKDKEKELERNKVKLREWAGELRALPLAATPTQALTGTNALSPQFRLAKLQTIAASNALGLILDAAVSAEEPKQRLAMANLLKNLSADWTQSGERPAPTLFTDSWTKLMDDDRPSLDDSVTLAFLAANESIYASPAQAAMARQCFLRHGKDGVAFLRGRVTARLAGTPEEQLPPYPEQVLVPPEDRAEVTEKLRSVVSRNEAASTINHLPLSIRATVPALLKADPELNAKLTPLALTVVQVTIEGDPALKEELSAWIGKPATAELAERLHQVLADKTARTQRCDIIFFRREHLGGCAISVRCESAKASEGFSASALARELRHQAQWRTAPLPEKRDWGTFTTSDPYTRRAFARAIATFFSSELDADSGGLIRYQTRDAP